MVTVTVLIPNWNRRDLLGKLLKQLREQTYRIGEIVVVDNGSADGSAELAEESGARVIRLESNRGFSVAVNTGIGSSRSEWIAIVNNDVEPARDWLEKLVEAALGSGAWFATGKLLSARDPSKLDGAFDVLCRSACAWRAGNGRPDGPLWARARGIRFAPFTAALFRSELFRRLGMLNEQFESYLEDVEFGLRCAMAGLGGVYVPEAVALHQGSATLGAWNPETVRRMARNQVLLAARLPWRRWWWPMLVGQALWGVLAIRHGAGAAWFAGKRDGFRRARSLPGPDPRALESAERVVRESEAEALEVQRQTGFDGYWRWYFALT